MTTKRRAMPSPDEARRIDAAYGLEPVFEPGAASDPNDPAAGADGGTEFQLIQCPYCGESFETRVDLSGGSASYIEDCQVCCQPIEFRLQVDAAGALQSLNVLRGD